MSDFETRLSTMLHAVADEPPRQLEAEDVFAEPSGRGRSVLLATAAAAAVVGITVVATLIGTAAVATHDVSPGITAPAPITVTLTKA